MTQIILLQMNINLYIIIKSKKLFLLVICKSKKCNMFSKCHVYLLQQNIVICIIPETLMKIIVLF